MQTYSHSTKPHIALVIARGETVRNFLYSNTLEDGANDKYRPHIVIVIGRGEVVRNFLYSDTLRTLSEKARVTLLSVVNDEKFVTRFQPYVERIIPLKKLPEKKLVMKLRDIIIHAHYRWLWSEKAKNKWEILDFEASRNTASIFEHQVWKEFIYLLANRPTLKALTTLERSLSWVLRPGDSLVTLFKELKPDLVFNGSHIGGDAADLPMRIAHRLGIPTAAFIFSWDNLTTRSRIFVPYDYYLVWHEYMRDELLSIYPSITPQRIFITGTPQFDFHFKSDFWLSREELCAYLGIDPKRSYILYTTGMASDFPEEYRHVKLVIETLKEFESSHRPQLVVRTYIKGNSPEMIALADQKIPDVVFPPILWDKEWFTPKYEDLAIYTSLLRHMALGINAASTVSLEAMMHNKPVINIGFDPPGSQLPHCYRWVRHIEYNHYRPVAESGAIMVAHSVTEMKQMIRDAFTHPKAKCKEQRAFLEHMFDSTLDGQAGKRVADCLIRLAQEDLPLRRGNWQE